MIASETAREILRYCGSPNGEDFHTLAGCHVDELLRFADQFRYRKPKNANGSRARYFHAYLQRRAAKGER